MMRTTVCVVICVVAMSGCAVGYYGPEFEPPALAEFPEDGAVFTVDGSLEAVRGNLLIHLNGLGLTYRQELVSPYEYIISAFQLEPVESGLRRQRKAAYLLRLNSSLETQGCTSVLLKHFVESSGDFEEEWSVQAGDAAYQPSDRGTIVDHLMGDPCND